MSNFAKILRYQHTSLFDNDSDKLLLLSILIPGLVKRRDKRGKTIDSFETILFFMFFFVLLHCLLIQRYACLNMFS